MKNTTNHHNHSHKAHCSLCGSEDFTNVEGYTSCCGETICTGHTSKIFVFRDEKENPVSQITTCCEGKAERQARKLGIKYDHF